MANGKFQIWWPLEGEGKASFSPPSTFHPWRFYLNYFLIDFRILFYHGSRALLCVNPFFFFTYKFHSRILMYHVFHPLIAKLILIKYFFFSWIHDLAYDHVLRVSSRTIERIIILRVIPIFHIDPTPSWWGSQTMRGLSLFQS